ncbi:MAG: ATP-dependent RecD-like DNA helicase [Gammaproteobacteria bacterium]|nr:ATP-dependent RecD-like DNA helicase [Gammaproteobacteria bacterium]
MNFNSANSTRPVAPQEKLSGAIERLTFHSQESGFCVIRVRIKGKRELVTVVGSAASISPGEYVECIGYWTNDRQHGVQFKALTLNIVPPSTLEGIQKYLGSGMVKGIGPHFAKKLVRAYGEHVFDVIEQTPERLLELDGIGPKRKQRVVSGWAEQKAVREIMVFLQSHGIGTSRAVRIYKTYGDEAVDKVRENPYRLALDIHGIGFKTADVLAQKLGIPKDSILRARAGIRHVLQEFSSQGHCGAYRQQLLETAEKLLGIEQHILEQAIADEISSDHLVGEYHNEQAIVLLSSLHHAESGCASNFLRLSAGNPPWPDIEPETAIPWVERATRLELSESQHQALEMMLKSRLCVLTGGPGVGKTTIINSFLAILANCDINTMLCAPTGRAAKRLSESTRREAKTVHRLLDFDPRTFAFKHNQTNPLETDLLVIDEASMMDITLMHHVLKALPDHAALLVVGDMDQLPSVGPGAVLADLIGSGCIQTVRLSEIFRQSRTSQIIVNAHQINAGIIPKASKTGTDSDFYLIPAQSAEDIFNKLMHVVTQRIPERFGFDPVKDLQVLTAMNRGGVGVRSLNIELQSRLNQSTQQITRYGVTFSPGDKVIQMVNNYDKDIYNGDIGRIVDIDEEESILNINFDGRTINYDYSELDEIQLAYAVSIHKSQGSEYPVIVIPLAMQHYMLLERNLIYTGITRGKQLVVVIAEMKALAMAVKSQKTQQRLTLLAPRLQALMAKTLQ